VQIREAATGAVLALTIAAGACAHSIELTHDYNTEFDFSEYRTYDWMPQSAGRRGRDGADSAQTHALLRAAAEEVLESRGFRKSPGGEPDFRIGYVLASDEEMTRETISNYYGPAWGVQRMYGPRHVRSSSQTVERRYEVGTVIIDIFDVESRELVWRGTGEGRVQGGAPDPEELQERANASVRQIMETFPPAN